VPPLEVILLNASAHVPLPANLSSLREKLHQKAKCLRSEFPGEPDAGNPHVRFDEGGVSRAMDGMRLLSHARGNPDTEVNRSLYQAIAYSSTGARSLS
jgi:hypothetical protein